MYVRVFFVCVCVSSLFLRLLTPLFSLSVCLSWPSRLRGVCQSAEVLAAQVVGQKSGRELISAQILADESISSMMTTDEGRGSKSKAPLVVVASPTDWLQRARQWTLRVWLTCQLACVARCFRHATLRVSLAALLAHCFARSLLAASRVPCDVVASSDAIHPPLQLHPRL